MRTRNHPKPGWLTRFAFDAHGNLRAGRLLGLASSVAFVVALGGLVIVFVTNAISKNALAWWTAGIFLAVKVPMMAFLWWLLGARSADSSELDADESREMIIRLRQRALGTGRQTDAADRFEGLLAEARWVAAHAPDEVTDEATALITEITERRDAVLLSPA